MNVFDLPDAVTSHDLQALLNIGRAQLSRIRSGTSGFPSPDRSRSTIRRPIWAKADIVRWLVAAGHEPSAALPAFDAPPSGPTEQRWLFDRTEFVSIDFGDTAVEVAAMRYRPLDTRDPRSLTIGIAVGERTGDHPLTLRLGHYLDPAIAETLGYHRHGRTGAVAFIVPSTRYGKPRVIGVNLPHDVHGAALDDGRTPFELLTLDDDTVAALIGHPLPRWFVGAVSKSAAAQWRPEPPESPLPVNAGIPPALQAAHQLRIHCRVVRDEIESGQRSAPDPIPDELAQLGNTAWDSELQHVFGYAWDLAERTPRGWVEAVVRPPASDDETRPLLPAQPPATDLFHALEWLVSQEDLPDTMLRYPIGYFGYPDSIKIATVDLTALPEDLHRLLTRSALVDRTFRPDWLHTALAEAAHTEEAADLTGCATKGWAADTAPDTHPALVCGDLLHFHVPRTLLPIGTPIAVHLVAQSNTGDRTYTAFLVDRQGSISPVPLVPDSLSTIADTLAAVVLGIDTPVHLGGTPKVLGGPVGLTRMAEAMRTTDHMMIDWSTLTEVVGPRPDVRDERELLRTVNEYHYVWGTPDRVRS